MIAVPQTPPRPQALTVIHDAIPGAIRDVPGWVAWRYELREGKWTKPPTNARTGGNALSTARDTWATFDEALAFYLRGDADGIGFSLEALPELVGQDLDHCVDRETGEIDPWALSIVNAMNSYTEISPSGEGLRILAFGTLPEDGRKRGNVEVYETGRYVTITGHRLPGTPETICHRQAEIEAFHAEHFPPRVTAPTVNGNGASPHFSDHDVLARAFRARNGAKVQALYAGDDGMHNGNASDADLALVGSLAFWTQDRAQLDRAFRGSPRMRAKWDEPHRADGATYGEMTIETALSSVGETYRGSTTANGAITPVDHGDFPLTDLGNAEAFAHLYGDRVRFDHARDRWLLWGAHAWRGDDDGALVRLAKECVRERLREASLLEHEDGRRAAVKHALASESRARLEAMLQLAKSEYPIADNGDGWDAEPMLLGVANGVVDLRTGRLRPGRPADRITITTPIEFDPDARCPRWEQFIGEIFAGDPELVSFIQRAIGYSLTGDTREQALFILHGLGANGKSVLLSVLRAILGGYGLNLAFSAFELSGRGQLTPDLAMLPGKRLVTSSETNDGTRLNEARIKTVTGNDSLTVNPKYKTPFEFRPVAKFWLTTNHRPRVTDDSFGFWRRIRLVPFTQRFDGDRADPKLETKLHDELPGILAWAVRGAVEWGGEGLVAPASVLAATDAYRADSDPLNDFIADRCTVAEGAMSAAGDLYKAYLSWANEQGLREREALTLTAFGRSMGGRFEKVHTRDGKVYRGVGIAPPGDGLDPPQSPFDDISDGDDGEGHERVTGFSGVGDGLEPRFPDFSNQPPHVESYGKARHNPSPVTGGVPQAPRTCVDCNTVVANGHARCDDCARAARDEAGDAFDREVGDL